MGVMVWMVAMAQTATLRLTVVAMIMATVIRQLIVTRRGVMCRLSDTWRLCRLSEASTPLLLAVVEPPENTLFSFKKEIRRGEIKK